MDPNANLQEQRELAAKILAESCSGESDPVDGERLAELVQALDEWRLHGGYDPYTGGE